MRGGLTTLDRDYGIFNKIHHDIGTHVIHHLFPQVRNCPKCLSSAHEAQVIMPAFVFIVQIPHYNLEAATEACKPVMGPYYREPAKSSGPFPSHLFEPLVRSFQVRIEGGNLRLTSYES